MEEHRKAAYRKILYHFLLDIRTAPFSSPTDNEAIIIGKYAGPVAYMFHSLALASVDNFDDFDESLFWKMLIQFEKQTGVRVGHYRKLFENLE